jgi:ribosomal protein L40E
VSDVRCRACGAALAPNATWCSLCFTDLRRPAEPAAAQATGAAPVPVASTAGVAAAARAEIAVAPTAAAAMRATVTAASADVLDATTPLPTEPPSAGAAPAAATPTWPCTRCGAKVSLDLDACPECGAGFLAGAASSTVSMKLPVVGDVSRMSKGQRLMMAAGFAVVLMLLLLLLAEVGGHIL